MSKSSFCRWDCVISNKNIVYSREITFRVMTIKICSDDSALGLKCDCTDNVNNDTFCKLPIKYVIR